MLAQLIPANGGPPITLERNVTVVGRNRQICDLHLDHSSVSKVHCLIIKTDGLLFFRDLGSSNGTRVNGQKAIRGALLPGDNLAFAAVKYRVHLGPSAAAASQQQIGIGDQTEVIPARKIAPAIPRAPQLPGVKAKPKAGAGHKPPKKRPQEPVDADLEIVD